MVMYLLPLSNRVNPIIEMIIGINPNITPAAAGGAVRAKNPQNLNCGGSLSLVVTLLCVHQYIFFLKYYKNV